MGRVIYTTRRISSEDGDLLVLRADTEPSAFVAAFLDAGGTSEVLLDGVTKSPRAAFWATANPEDPVFRAAWFEDGGRRALTGKATRSGVSTKTLIGERLVDPLTTLYFARAVELPIGEELRLGVVEGTDLHLMILSALDQEDLVHDGKPVPCTRISVRSHRLAADGTLAEVEPGNSLFAWIAEIEGRPILRMSGRTVFGKVAMKLAQRTVGDSDGT